MKRVGLRFVFVMLAFAGSASSGSAQPLAARLQKLEPAVFTPAETRQKQLSEMLAADVRSRIHAAHRREAEAWQGLSSRADWERYRDLRLPALRESLGAFQPAPTELKIHTTQTLEGDGYRVKNLLFESRPGLWVAANLYLPARPPASMPGIQIVHGFHQPKSQAELQDMGVNWARLGCAVLVPDQLCHGERRQHPFREASSYPGKFNLPRQDYYSRANTGLHLHLAGESLMGWMVCDVLRGIDVLLAQAGVDRDRIVLLGALAAGGDTAAVAAALDARIAAVVPFNFGGPEPETAYPLPAEAELAFPYASGGHWDSTRRLARSARDGFLPWVVLGSVAPRRLVYAHEFAWDRDHDPVWPRLQKIYEWYGAADHVASLHGSGTLFGNPEGTGCANIGAVHRQPLYPLLQRWFAMKPPDKEMQERRPAEELRCWTAGIEKELQPRLVHQIVADLADRRLTAARASRARLSAEERRAIVKREWARLLGDIEPPGDVPARERGREQVGANTIERIALEVEPRIVVPLLLLRPGNAGAKVPVVIGLAQPGKQGFLQQRSDAVAKLLQGGVAVCLPDLRGTGETRPAGDRRGPPAGRLVTVQETSPGTLLACENQMLGQTLLGTRLRDLRAVLRYLRGRADVDGSRVGLWGESLAEVNAANRNLQVPWDADQLPHQAEPMGPLVAMLAALWETDVHTVAVKGSMASYRSLLDSPFCYVPHDAVVPGVLTVCDLDDVAATLAPRPLFMAGLVDGRNCGVTGKALSTAVAQTRAAYRQAPDQLQLVETEGAPASWLVMQLGQK